MELFTSEIIFYQQNGCSVVLDGINVRYGQIYTGIQRMKVAWSSVCCIIYTATVTEHMLNKYYKNVCHVFEQGLRESLSAIFNARLFILLLRAESVTYENVVVHRGTLFCIPRDTIICTFLLRYQSKSRTRILISTLIAA